MKGIMNMWQNAHYKGNLSHGFHRRVHFLLVYTYTLIYLFIPNVLFHLNHNKEDEKEKYSTEVSFSSW